MKRINSALTDAGIETELIYCSSDPASLDGVYAPALNCWIADGTSPHTLEPKYPGAAQEIVDLGRFWDKIFCVRVRMRLSHWPTKTPRATADAGAFSKPPLCCARIYCA